MKYKKSLAILVHYSMDGKVCSNAMLYANELANHFDEVVISSNIPINIENKRITPLFFTKNAYDFGYFYQALVVMNAFNNYETIGFFNDSNYVLNPLDTVLEWCMSNDSEFCGITDTYEGRPDIKIENQYHIQSHFLVFKGNAVCKLKDFIEKIDFDNLIKREQNPEKIRASIVINCEIMMSLFFAKNGIKMSSFIDSREFIKKAGRNLPEKTNVHVWLWNELIENGYPLIKKKIVHQSFPKNDMDTINAQKSIYPMKKALSVIEKYGKPEFVETITKP